MRLLVVTDHRFYAAPDGIFDTYCFERAFFDDYRTVFEAVRVMAPLRHAPLPSGARRSDGDGVSFVPLPNWSGPRWMLGLPLLRRRFIARAVQEADAVCLRLPSVSGDVAFAAACKLGKPVMFELIGDMEAALTSGGRGRLTKMIGRWNAARIRQITRHAVCGSYVSRQHLQIAYPPGGSTVHDSISSIRLPQEAIFPARKFHAMPSPLRLVLVASLVPVKAHDVLLRGVNAATRRGAGLTLDLVGSGARQAELENLAQELGIAPRVKFHGHVSGRENVDAILDAADLFAMSSTTEGMPRAMIEAMARGLPALGSAVGGIAEILSEEQQFPAGDWRRLGELLATIDADKLNRWAAHSQSTAREFTQHELALKRQRLLHVLREAANKSRSAV